MIISEKQILELIMIAESYANLMYKVDKKGLAKRIFLLLDFIHGQQSEEFKKVE